VSFPIKGTATHRESNKVCNPSIASQQVLYHLSYTTYFNHPV